MKLSFLFLILILPLISFSQDSRYLQSGFISLTLKFSGKFPVQKPITTPLLTNAFVNSKPLDIIEINDSTINISYYTFGPSMINFFYNGNYSKFTMLPNQYSSLKVNYTDLVNFTMDYEGPFKEVFENSKIFGELITEALFSGPYFLNLKKKYKNANEYRDTVLIEINRTVDALAKNIPNEFVKQLFESDMQPVLKYFELISKYKSRVFTEIETDSGIRQIPLLRDISYYQNIDVTSHSNPEKLLSPPISLYSGLRKDTLLNLPDIFLSGPHNYENKLKDIFDREIKNRENLFYEIMIAGAYMDKIEQGIELSDGQKYDILNFFKNKGISDYIIFHNILNAKGKNIALKKYYLDFDKTKEAVFEEILARYKDKVIVIDFWATWCGPCIQVSNQMRSMRSKFSNENVAFLFLTNETSDKVEWEKIINYLGGEQYYLYKHQSKLIHDKYSIDFLPSYLLFGKDGKLVTKSIGQYMGNEKLEEMINRELKK